MIALIKEIQPEFAPTIKFVWTDEERYLSKRQTFGITWDDLPAIGLYSLKDFDSNYHKSKPFIKDQLVEWLTDAKSFNSDAEFSDFMEKGLDFSDEKMTNYFLRYTK